MKKEIISLKKQSKLNWWVESTITGCILISAFASLIGTAVGITSSATGLKFCATTADIKKYKSMIKKKKKRHDKIVLIIQIA